MAKDWLTDAQVEKEIERLRQSPMVALARKEQRVRYQRRQILYNLRNLEKKGRELADAGITFEILDAMDSEECLFLERQASPFTPEQRAAVLKALDDPKKRATICKLLGMSAE